MRVKIPIPPNTMNAAAPDGAPPRRFRYTLITTALPRRASQNLMVLLASHSCGIRCPGEALRRGTLTTLVVYYIRYPVSPPLSCVVQISTTIYD
jgi:hypothetical protein